MWTLVIFVVVGGPSIEVDGFSNPNDCRLLGQLNVEYVQVGLPAKYQCSKTDRPPIVCKKDTRTYNRTAACLMEA